METNWAAEHLQTIRTLMERSALYRRALAPVFTFVGVIGTAGAVIGWQLKIDALDSFPVYWMGVCLVVLAGALVLVRRQALKNAENFWSPPTRRIAFAILPAMLVGLVFGVLMTLAAPQLNLDAIHSRYMDYCLVPIWALLYGLALHAAGFFMPRGIRLFGWCFVMSGIVLLVLIFRGFLSNWSVSPHWVMGILFGLSHLAYGIYLYFTEQGKNEA